MKTKNDLSRNKKVIRNNITARPSLGQHFIKDNNIINMIIDSAGNLKNKVVYEVGPGSGNLTKALLSTAASKIIAIEKDKRCCNALTEIEKNSKDRFKLIEGDALIFDEKSLSIDSMINISNLPYNISTELLFKWIDQCAPFEKYILMFQKEVANRIIAKNNSKSYGRLSVIVQWQYYAKLLFDVPASAFIPEPKINSSVILLLKRAKPLAPAPYESLQLVLKSAFGNRRKMLRSSLKNLTKSPKKLLNEAKINENKRPENLTIEEFCNLASCYDEKYTNTS